MMESGRLMDILIRHGVFTERHRIGLAQTLRDDPEFDPAQFALFVGTADATNPLPPDELEREIAEALAEFHRLEIVDVAADSQPPREMLGPEWTELARRHTLLPLCSDSHRILIAVANPGDALMRRGVEELAGNRVVTFMVSTVSALEVAVERNYGPLLIPIGALRRRQEREVHPEPVPLEELHVSREDIARMGETERQAIPLAAAHRRMAFALLRGLERRKPGDNVVFSPYSVAQLLTLLWTGATGETRRELGAVLGFQELEAATIALRCESLAWLLEQLNGTETALRWRAESIRESHPEVLGLKLETAPHVLSIANSLWIQQGLPVLPAFRESAARTFRVHMATADFQQAAGEARRAVNGWVEAHTNGRIRDLVDFFDMHTVLAAVNAMYLKARWASPFDRDQTRPAPFYCPDQPPGTVEMMQQSGSFPYWRGDGVQVIRLPYRNGHTGMLIVLPDTVDGLRGVLERLDEETWQGWSHSLTPAEGRVCLPRFQADATLPMEQTLSAMGAGTAFTTAADFTAMTPAHPVFLSSVLHKAFLSVDEEGTEAAAATMIAMAKSMPERMFDIVVDHPFLCAIHDYRTSTMLFLGVIFRPESQSG